MKKLLAVIGTLALLLGFNTNADDLGVWISVAPGTAHVGEPVTYTAQPTGGSGVYECFWVSDDIPTRVIRNTSVTVTYNSTGWKTMDVNVESMTNWLGQLYTEQYLERRTMIQVYNSLNTGITVLSPNGGEVWEVGKTYQILWKSTGSAQKVQIGLRDSRFFTEFGEAGETTIAYSVDNTGSYFYTVPPPNTNSISYGNLGGTNYTIIVYPWDGGDAGISTNKFAIRDTKPQIMALTSKSNDVVSLTLNARSNNAYTVEESFDFKEWHTIGMPVSGSSDTLSFSVTGTKPQASYRTKLFRVFAPSVELVELPTYGLADGVLLRWKVQAPNSVEISCGKQSFVIRTNGCTMGRLHLNGYSDPDYTIGVATDWWDYSDNTPTDQVWMYQQTKDGSIINFGTTRYYELTADDIFIGQGGSITVTLEGDDSYTVGKFDAVDIPSDNHHFIWSSMPYGGLDSESWHTGYDLSGLPARGVSQTRFE